MLIPALALAETDWHRGELDEGRHNFILQGLKEMIQERSEGQQEAEAQKGIEDGNTPQPCILCLPARDEADEIAGMMLAQLLATRSKMCIRDRFDLDQTRLEAAGADRGAVVSRSLRLAITRKPINP